MPEFRKLSVLGFARSLFAGTLSLAQRMATLGAIFTLPVVTRPTPEQMLIMLGIAKACPTGSSMPNPANASQAPGANNESLDRIAELAGARLAIGIKRGCNDPCVRERAPAQAQVAFVPFNQSQGFERT